MREKRVRHSALVYKLCRRYRWIDSPSYNYEDFVQDAMFSAWRSTRDESSLTCAPSTAVGYAVIRAAQHNIGRMLMPVKLPRKVTANRYWRAPEPEVSSEPPAGKVALGPRLLAALEALPERERAILRMRYVLGYTLEEVGAEYGITRERVRQIESRALGRIRAAMAAGERRGAP